MKRPASALEVSQERSRRQPQVSCDFCRSKKLKCDRQQPCSSCASRGLACEGQPARSITSDSSSQIRNESQLDTQAALLDRLRLLEQAVFGASGGSQGEEDSPHTAGLIYPQGAQPLSQPQTAGLVPTTLYNQDHNADEPQNTATKLLEFACTRDDSLVSNLSHSTRLAFKVIPLYQIVEEVRQGKTEELPCSAMSGGMKQILFPPKDDAFALLEKYATGVHYLYPMVSLTATRKLIIDFYAHLVHGHQAQISHVALFLGIFSAVSYFWEMRDRETCYFPCPGSAARCSTVWRNTALDLLELSRRTTSGSLEDIQATMIVSYLIYNIEGCSPRYRLLHGTALVIARDLSLHRIDSHTNPGSGSDEREHFADLEIKRRLWWHIASTDWLLAFMGGPQEGVYSVHPKRVTVALPFNFNDSDLTQGAGPVQRPPLSVPTEMSYFIQRIYLGIICREIVDSIPSTSVTLEDIEYNQILALDQKFENYFSDLPPFFQLDGTVPIPMANKTLMTQRFLIHLGAHARRSRLHRPFLLRGAQYKRYAPSRAICLHSARTVISVATQVQQAAGVELPERMSTIVQHAFMASMVLALELCFNQANGFDGDRQRAEFADACRVLSCAGEESPVAASLLKRLSSILHKHRITLDDSSSPNSINTNHSYSNHHQHQQHQQKENRDRGTPAHQAVLQAPAQTPAKVDAPPLVIPKLPVVGDTNAELSDAMWHDIIGKDPGFKDMDWDMLFTDLDSFWGTRI